MTEAKRPLKVFLCHAHSDKDAVKALYAHLIKDGVDAWLDKEKLIPGQDWKLEIEKAVGESDVVIICLSKQFNLEGFKQREVRWALDQALEKPEGEIFIIPARLEECDTLESLSKWHWVDLFEDNGYEMLMRALRARADRIGVILQIKRNKTVTKSGVQRRLTPITFLYITFFLFFIGSLSLLPLLDLSGKNNKSPVTQAAEITVTFSPEAIQPTDTSTPLPTEITDAKGVSMMLVPAGEFIMGSDIDKVFAECVKFHNNCQREWFLNETPPRRINLDAFYIDKYEVTNASYKSCVNAQICTPPGSIQSFTRNSYYDNSIYDDYPVIYVDWYQAKTYCEWRGLQLPTEQQWEKAARGTDDRIYPWGNDLEGGYANFCDKNCPMQWANERFDDGFTDTAPVGSYPAGRSPYGVYDMSGNVWEWVDDWFNVHTEDSIDVLQHETLYRVIRGGTWDVVPMGLRVSYRNAQNPSSKYFSVGFRCVYSIAQ